jgi:hypothetical protein
MFDWLRRRRDEPLELGFGAAIEFIGRQQGVDGSRLTRALTVLFADWPVVERAYLARVRYGEQHPVDVALCLVGGESEGLHAAIARAFWAMFETGQHLDVIFVTPGEEQRLAAVCEPFFARA